MTHFQHFARLGTAGLCATLAAALLAGCETSMTTSVGKKIDYKSASSAPALEIPPDLSTPGYDDRYATSTASGAAAARRRQDDRASPTQC
jgi:outer membrane protein assembly factor BamC